mgnify:CR=1 FL=1
MSALEKKETFGRTPSYVVQLTSLRYEIPCRKGPGGTGGWQLDMRQQHALAAQKANRVLGCIKRVREGDPAPLLCAARAHLEHCVQRWSLQYRRDVELLQCGQRPQK